MHGFEDINLIYLEGGGERERLGLYPNLRHNAGVQAFGSSSAPFQEH